MSHRHVFFLTTDRSRAGGSQPMLTTTLCRLLRRQASGRGCWRKTSCDAGLADAAGFGIAQARVSGPSAWMRLPSIHACQRRHAFRFPQRDDFPLVSFVGSILCNSHVALLLYFACLSLDTFPRTVWIFFPFGLIHLVPLLPANAVFIQPTMLVCRSWVGRYLLTANVALDLPSFGPLAFL